MIAWMMWLAGAAAVILFAYLLYALLRAEQLE